jgi:hypothetical protein
MFRKISYTWGVMGAAWDILKRDKTLLIFPLLSGICCLVVLASFAIPMWLTGAWQPPQGEATQTQHILYCGTLFLFYLVNYFVITFFNTAIISCAVLRMVGGEPTVADGFREAAARLPQIAGWALVQATVGLILRIIEDRSEKLGRIVAGLLGMAWTVVTYLVVPIIVVERKGPFAALKGSTELLKRTWGEQLVGNFGFGLVFTVLSLPAIALIVLSIFSGSAALIVLCVTVAVLFLLVLALVQSALQSIFQAAVCLFARDGTEPGGFSGELLAAAMRTR